MFVLLDNIIPIYFFISLFIGLFIAYLTTPKPTIIIRHPTPENAGKHIYIDNSNVCYKYKAKEVKCPKDIQDISPTPIQHVDTDKINNRGVISNIKQTLF